MENSANSLRASSARVFGHFGEWLQGCLGPDGPVALISIPCPNYWCDVELTAEDTVKVTECNLLPNERVKAALQALKCEYTRTIYVTSNLVTKAGLGASTASLVALIRAASERDLSPQQISDICVSIEGATDPLMHESFDTLLWSSRQGQIVSSLPQPPRFEIVGGLWGAGEVTDPSDNRFPDIADLVDRWTIATKTRDHAEISAIATTSATRTTEMRGPADDPTGKLAKELGALGWVRAHTGSARGLLFRPGTVPSEALKRMSQVGYKHTTHFMTGN